MTESWRTDITAATSTPASTEDASQLTSSLKSSWIRRFMPQPSTDPDEQHDSSSASFARDQGTSQGFDQMGSSCIPRSRACSLLFRDADEFPTRFKRTQEVENENPQQAEACKAKFLDSSSLGHASSPKKSRIDACARQLSVSLDMGSFLPRCGEYGAMPVEGLKLHSSENAAAQGCAPFRGPLPYSSFRRFEGQQNTEMNRGKHESLEPTEDSVRILRICSKEEPKGFASLLTPVPSLACLSSRYERCEEASSTTNMLYKEMSNYRAQQHENSSSSKATHSAFWNDSTPSDSQDFVLSRPPPSGYKAGEGLSWLNRWSPSGFDDAVESSTSSMTVFEDSRSKPSSRYVPSAAAMAIIGKSSMNMNSSSTASWCNSVSSWQSEDCEANASSTRKP